MEMAYKADMDIINLSFGENGGWAEDPLAVVADRMVEAGVHGECNENETGVSSPVVTILIKIHHALKWWWPAETLEQMAPS